MKNPNQSHMFSNQIQGYEKDIVKLFDFNPDLCGISRVADGKILVVNHSFCQLFEYEEQELLGKTSTELDLYYYKDRDRFSETLKRDKQLTNYEVRVQTKSGKILTLIVAASFIEYKNEQCISFQAHDITDRKAIEEELRLKNRELIRAQEIAKIGSWYLDLKTNEVSWTEELYKMYGFDSSKPVPPYTEHMKLFTKESWELLSKSLQNTVDTGEPYELELRTVRKDKGNGWMWVRGEQVKNNKNKVIGLWGAAQDITSRKETEIKLVEKERSFELAIQSAKAGTLFMNFEKGYLYWDKRSLDIFEISEDEFTYNYEGWLKWVHPDDKQEANDTIQKIIDEGGTEVDMNYRIITGKNNIRYIRGLAIIERDNKGKPTTINGLHFDVSDEKLAEIELKETLQKLEQSNKELQEFAYVASHDLQEPLRKVKNYIDLLDRHYSDSFDEKARKYMNVISSGANRMQILIKDILRLSRVATRGEEFRPADMNILVGQVLDILQVSIKESEAEIVLGELPNVKCDKIQIGQLFQNLIGNSLKFKGEKKPLIKIEATQREGEWEFCVSDNGIGFNPESC